MLDDLIKLLLCMPIPNLSPASQHEFLGRTRLLAANLCLSSFNQLLIEKPKTNFTAKELSEIRSYLKSWPELTRELHYFLEILHIAWYDEHQSPTGGDDILPLFYQLLAKDHALLPTLLPRLLFAADVDKNNSSTYYFTVLAIACEKIISESSNREVKSEDDDKPDKYTRLLTKLHNQTYYNLIFILVKLSALCQYRMQVCEDLIFTSLQKHNNKDYLLDEFISEEEKHQTSSLHIRKMADQLKLEPFASDAILTARVRRHIIYQDFEITLSRTNILGMLKLVELANKFEVHKQGTLDEFNSIDIELSDRVRNFLAIPNVRQRSIVNLFWAAPVKVPLNTFIAHLTKKMDELNDELLEKTEPSFIIPEPKQLADLLRQSF